MPGPDALVFQALLSWIVVGNTTTFSVGGPVRVGVGVNTGPGREHRHPLEAV